MVGGRSILHAAQDLDPAVEVAVHQVGRTDPVLRGTIVREIEDPGMLEKATEDRPNGDVLGQPGDAGPDRAECPHQQLDANPGHRRTVKRIDSQLVDQVVGLYLYPCVLAVLLVQDLSVDALDQSGADALWRDQEGSVRR